MLNEHHKKFGKVLNSFDYGTRLYDKFYEFCKLSALTLSAPFNKEFASEEIKKLKIHENEKKLLAYNECFEILLAALEHEHQDFLGVFYGVNELGNSKNGQFFTPYHLSLMIAKMQLSGITELIKEKGFIKICEPACGSGGMIIAVREILIESGFNPSTNIYVELTDVDALCFYMAYIQISLYGIPARVIHGNTLTREQHLELFTPVYFLNDFPTKLAISEIMNSGILNSKPKQVLKPKPETVPDLILEKSGQFEMAL